MPTPIQTVAAARLGTRLKSSVQAVCLAACFAASTAQATPSLTQAGIDLGFDLSTFFARQGTWDVLAVTTAPDGTLIASGYAGYQLLKFAEGSGNTVSNQDLTNVIASGSVYPGQPSGVATAGGAVYAALLDGGIYKVNTSNMTISSIGMSGAGTMRYGIAGSAGGTLVAATSQGVFKVDPATGATVKIFNMGNNDGLALSADGTIAYVEAGNVIYEVSVTNPNPTTPLASYTGAQTHGADGVAVINGGALNGDLVVSNNDGTIGLINTSTSDYTTIASGMSRGDLASPDANNGTLLVTDWSAVYRLGLSGASIGSAPVSAPEPAAIGLLALGAALTGAIRRRSRIGKAMV